MAAEAFEKYADLERYIFEEVSPRFESTQRISAFDFFCIVIWKANRAKSRVAARLLAPAHGHQDLDCAVSAPLCHSSCRLDTSVTLGALRNDSGSIRQRIQRTCGGSPATA